MEPEAARTTEAGIDAGGLLSRIRCILVEPSHPGNIGAAARALKTMGITGLDLVKPRFFPSAAATARASGADDLLVGARVHETLAAAVADCALVVGTTARARYLEWPIDSPREAAAWLAAQPGEPEIALVFGREQAGLTNDELALCQRAIRIPTDPAFSSLNLAQAVQLCAYELRLEAHAKDALAMSDVTDDPVATAGEIDQLATHWLTVMKEVGYFDPARPKLLPRRVQRLLAKASLRHSEIQILRGFLTAIERRMD